MDLPSEIVLSILGYLAGPDLKSARLVSKHWSLCAAEHLFDVIYISPSKLDIEVFQAITQHPILSKCPRRLEYVGAEFLADFSKKGYAEELWEQTHEQLYFYSKASDEQWIDPDPTINAWINETVLPNEYAEFKDVDSLYDCKIVNDAYLIYQEHARYQRDVLDGFQSSQISEIMVRGLQHLTFLASVTLQPDWPLRRGENCRSITRGSPLARSWHTFFPGPRGLGYKGPRGAGTGYFEDPPQGTDGAEHYLIISSALAQAQKRIRRFQIGQTWSEFNGVPLYVFDSTHHLHTGLDITAFSGLENFGMKLAFQHDRRTDVHHLQVLLVSMDQLITLDLTLSGSIHILASLYTQEKVFSAANVWSKLTGLKLGRMSTTASDLLLLLIFQMPKMRNLELEDINLLQGTWHCVIEGLKQSNRISSFHMSVAADLVHRSGTNFMRGASRFLSPVRNYIIHGGHHPCIPPNESSDAALGCMVNIEVSVRDRLAELDSMRSEELDSVARKAWMDAMPEWSEHRKEFDHFDGSQACWEILIEKDRYYSNFTL